MEKLQLVFSRSHHIGSALIRLGTWSSWGHCGIIHDFWGEARVIDAKARHGVQERLLSDYLSETSEYAFKDVEVPNAAAGIAWAKAQIGKKYDWSGIFSFIGRENWNEDDKWFCSELAEGAILAAGRQRFSHNIERVTPQLCWMVN
jgi:uncharacterized protein YycO